MPHPPPNDADLENDGGGDEAPPPNNPSSASGATPPNRSRPLGAQSVRGAAWVIFFSTSSKVIGIGLKLLILAILVPDDMGIIGYAAGFTSLAIVGSGSLQAWLVRRTQSFYEDAEQVFWLGLTMGVAMGLALTVAAPFAGLIYGEVRVTYVMLISAIGIATASVSTIYYASLEYTLRFRSLAAIHFVRMCMESLLMLLLAQRGWGAYSIVVPQALSPLLGLAIARFTAGRLTFGFPKNDRWLVILKPTIWLMLFNMAIQVRTTGPNSAAGMFHDTATIGYLTTGSLVAVQSVFVLATGLRGVFFATLAKLNAEPLRQFGAAIKGTQTLLIVMMPVCLLQALLAGPGLEFLIVKEWMPSVTKWLPAVPVVALLSLGMITQPIAVLASALLMARGRFILLTCLTAASTVTVIAASLFGAWIGKQNEIAACVAISLFMSNAAIGFYSYRKLGHAWHYCVEMVWRPFVIAIPTGLIGYGASAYWDSWGVRWQIMGILVSVSVSYALLVYFVMPDIALEIVKRLRSSSSPQPPEPTDSTDM